MGRPSKAERKQRRQLVKRLVSHAVAARIVRAVHSEHQLREVMVDFWANHFSVFAMKGAVGGTLLSYENDVLRSRALGRFEDLLLAVAQSPTMLVYLDNIRSGARGAINENYARELLELHTLGVDAGYDQRDVLEVARVLSGWSVGRAARPAFEFRPRLHVPGAKSVLGERVPGAGVDEGISLLRRLARHPSTARHVSRKLVTRFVSDSPPPGLVERAAKRFSASGGHIAEVLRTILSSPEFVDPANVKLKTPFEFVASALRETGGETDGGRRLRRELGLLGELPWFARTPEGHPDQAVDWIDPSAMLARISLGFRLGKGLAGTRLGAIIPSGAQTLAADQSLSAIERVAVAVSSPGFQWQ